MNTTDQQRDELGLTHLFWGVLSLPLIPVMLVIGALSIPYSKITGHFQRQREKKLMHEMAAVDRTIEWNVCLEKLKRGEGTLLVERISIKGPIRCWWTPENVYDLCPFPLVDWWTMSEDSTFQPAADWCHERYTDANTGHAKLVLLTNATNEDIADLYGDGELLQNLRSIVITSPSKVNSDTIRP